MGVWGHSHRHPQPPATPKIIYEKYNGARKGGKGTGRRRKRHMGEYEATPIGGRGENQATPIGGRGENARKGETG